MVDLILEKKMKDKYGDEKVFVVPNNIFDDVSKGFVKKKHSNSIWSKYDTLGTYVFKYNANNPVFMTIVPSFFVFDPDTNRYYVAKDKKSNSLELVFGKAIDEKLGTYQVMLKGLTDNMVTILDFDILEKAQLVGSIKDINKKEYAPIFGLKSKAVIHNDKNKENLWMTEEEIFEKYTNFDGYSKDIIDFLYSQYNKK